MLANEVNYDRGLRVEQTVYLHLEELAHILYHARITGCLAMFELRPHDVVIELPEDLTELTARERDIVAAAMLAAIDAAPEGRNALPWGALGDFVRVARLTGGLAAIGRPWKAHALRLYSLTEVSGFDVGALIIALNKRADSYAPPANVVR